MSTRFRAWLLQQERLTLLADALSLGACWQCVNLSFSGGTPSPTYWVAMGIGIALLPPAGKQGGLWRRWAVQFGYRAGLGALVGLSFWIFARSESHVPVATSLWLLISGAVLPGGPVQWAISRSAQKHGAASAPVGFGRLGALACPFSVPRIAAECVVVGIALSIVGRVWPEMAIGTTPFLWGALGWLFVAAALVRRSVPEGWRLLVLCLCLGAAIVARAAFASHPPWGTVAIAVFWSWLGIGFVHGLPRWLGCDADGYPDERVRIAVVLGAAYFLYQPILYPVIHGAGDAVWYGTLLADMLAQVRNGIFPVFGGQSLFQFNGSLYPVRIAPGFQYFGALIDYATGQRLAVLAVQNLLLVVWSLLGALSTYASLVSLAPKHRGWAMVGAVLFISCPGVMSVAYNTDLYMSWMTVPFVPLALMATAKTFDEVTIPRTVLLGLSLGLLWWGHTPIALWTTILALFAQIYRLILFLRTWRRDLVRLVPGALVFSGVAAFPIAAALLFPSEPGVDVGGFQQATAETILFFLRISYWGTLLPIAGGGRYLSGFQLGYALWAVLAIAAWFSVGKARPKSRFFLAAAIAWILLLTPVPGLGEVVWRLVPAFVRNTTGNWVMNRLYLIFAAIAVIFASTVVAQTGRVTKERRRRVTILAAGILLFWSLSEGRKFGAHSDQFRRSTQDSSVVLAPENVMITRFAYLVFPKIPSYFSNGAVDPEMEHRFFDDSGRLLWSNESAVLRAAEDGDRRVHRTELGNFSPIKDDPNIQELSEPITLAPGRHYLLKFDFPQREELSGALEFTGRTLFRSYELPSSGLPKAFGSNAEGASTLALSSSSPNGDSIVLRFHSKSEASAEAITRASVELIEYDRDILPAKVLSWIPYRVQVNIPQSGWLETPRSYQNYWQTEGGAPIKRSPEDLVMVKCTEGREVIGLNYLVPIGFYIIFWLSMISLVSGVAVVLEANRKERSNRKPAHSSYGHDGHVEADR